MRTKFWFKVSRAAVPDSATALGIGMCTAVEDTGLKELIICSPSPNPTPPPPPVVTVIVN